MGWERVGGRGREGTGGKGNSSIRQSMHESKPAVDKDDVVAMA